MPHGIRKAKAVLASEIEPLCVGVDQAQTLSGISRWTWRTWAQKGIVSSIKIGGRTGKLGRGGRLLIPIEEIRRVLAESYRPRLADAELKRVPSRGA